ncbi:MAG: pyridoxal phosphate-dependent aminotransferase [Methylotenera sp.]|uniref:pyridoxal phosphate-dependent aminotransferase n=1 Tax=Methylotenera sp. TaxID=2051956 RepID=UPI00271D345D|nr:pyridoxal phosphate-dependent aminotransferase [Methylotenera sp.]MDO9205906.1 pyridoxal phosphate-dependent aminotransferase [Methylotenera sp.]MDO9393347.1 pyridoxal phosphate-dependent aminotransferase [Methylotenera sp.]MDP1523329.1 pyridoxal phosphate-dependent aminotransferase [Methylotenera sp.]MDP3308836.1 pyridoxal phosphate-dependent aminotransferase [Methylotenera sp.]MDP3819472.1 pyridoxal phosphate-dependent aminotransferase [Methylotenera sp.]
MSQSSAYQASVLSKRVQSIKESPTLAITAKAGKYKAEGRDIIGLAAGEPDFDTPQHIKDAAKTAIDNGFTKYTPVAGIPGLKKAIVNKFKNENGFDYALNEVIVGVGGKQTIFNLCLAVLNKDDEVIIPAPYWVSYADIALVAEATPVIIECGIEQGFKLLPAQLEAAITPKTKIFMINSPSNPTGAVYSLSELKALGEVLLKHPHVLVATDDMYEHVNLTGDKFYNILNATPALKDRCIVLNGVSKAYSMTGWRIGYAAGPAYIIKAMEILQSQSTSNATSISQVAAQAALEGSQDCITPMVTAFKERHIYVVNRFNKMPGLSCLMAGGAFYAFPDARGAIANLYNAGKIKAATDMALAEYLLEEFDVAVVPGSAFGAEGYFRISFATSMTNLQNALNRIEKALS